MKNTEIHFTIGTTEYYNELVLSARRQFNSFHFNDVALTPEDIAMDVFIKTNPSNGKVVSRAGVNVLVRRFLIDNKRLSSNNKLSRCEVLPEVPYFDESPEDISADITPNEFIHRVEVAIKKNNNRRKLLNHLDGMPYDVRSIVESLI